MSKRKKNIELFNIPGHATESIAIIDKTNKLAFLGDYLYNGALFIFGKDKLQPYRESVDLLLSKLDDEYRLFGAHGSPEVKFEKLKLLKEFLTCIDNTNCTPTHDTVWGMQIEKYTFQGMQIWIFI